jgi:hypothetical protein
VATGHSLSTSEITRSNGSAAHQHGKRYMHRAHIPFWVRSETSKELPAVPSLQHHLTREIKFYQVLRLLFTRSGASPHSLRARKSSRFPHPVSPPSGVAVDLLPFSQPFQAVKPDVKNLLLIFIASLCFFCVTDVSSFDPIQGAFHSNVIAGHRRWSKP